MSDHLTPPPRRPLPPEVRDRIRGTVTAGLVSASVARMNRLRAPLAAAASVAVLAAGAAIVAQSVGNTGGGVGTPTTAPTTTSGATLDRAKANAELDRCWAAVQREGKAGQFPDRSQWRPVMNYNFGPVNVTAARAAGKPLFCETTHTSVTVSDPNATPAYGDGTRTGTVLFSRLGTVAGVVDESWPWPWAELSADIGPVAAPVTRKDGLFLLHAPIEKTPVNNTIKMAREDPANTDAKWLPLPPAPPPAVSVVDRPTAPAPDRTSTRGKLLDECLNDESLAVVDAESWAPGALWRDGADYVIAARNAFGFATCWRMGGQTYFNGYRAGPEAAQEAKPNDLHMMIGDRPVLVGTVPENCVLMQVNLSDGNTVNADVLNATYAVQLPVESGNPKRPTATLYDANDKVIYDGPLN